LLADTTASEQCILGFLETGDDSLTLGEMRARCAEQESTQTEDTSGIESRLSAEREAALLKEPKYYFNDNGVVLGYSG
jgi:hypothetical protein